MSCLSGLFASLSGLCALCLVCLGCPLLPTSKINTSTCSVCYAHVHVYIYVHYVHTCMLFVQDVRRKVARVVAAKCTLAARVDSFHESPGGEVGVGMLCVL